MSTADALIVAEVFAHDRTEFELHTRRRAIAKSKWEQRSKEGFTFNGLEAEEFHVLEVEGRLGHEVDTADAGFRTRISDRGICGAGR